MFNSPIYFMIIENDEQNFQDDHQRIPQWKIKINIFINSIKRYFNFDFIRRNTSTS